MKQAQQEQTNNKRRTTLVRIGIILLSVTLLASLVSAIYLGSLFSLIKGPDYTGNPTLQESDLTDPSETDDPTAESTIAGPSGTADPAIQESDLVDPDETVQAPDSTEEMSQAEKDFAAVQAIAVPQDKNVYNILLIGTDSRGSDINGRSDSMVILSVNKRTRRVNIVSLMRTLYVKIPGRDFYMLNAAYAYGGPKLLLRTIEDNFRVRIDDYVAINFQGFVKAIDVLGGVEVTLTSAEVTHLTKLHPDATLVVGTNLLMGDLALEFSRIRKIDSDFRRTGRQREVLESLIRKLSTVSADQMDATARQLLPLVRTNKSASSLASLAVNALAYRSYPIKQLMIPIDGTHKMILVRGQQLEWFDKVKNVQALHKMLY